MRVLTGLRSRRRFISGAAAAACAALVAREPGEAYARPLRGTPSIAIVGAGIGGLTAALVLHDRGVRATVYEAQSRLGGRMHSEATFWDDGQTSEYGGELIDTDHTTMQALAKRFGLRLTDVLEGEVAEAQQTIFQRGGYYTEEQLFRDFRALYPTLAAQVKAAGPATTYAHSTPTGRALDRMNLNEWITRFVPGGLASNLGTYILLQYVAEYGIEAERQSALDTVYWLGRQPNYDPRTGEFVALGPSDQRFHIAGGNAQLPSAIAASLPPGTVRRGHRLESIVRRSDGRVALHFATPDGAREIVADHAIVTIPFNVLRGLDLQRAGFDERKRIAIAELGYGDHSKLVVQFAERYWRGTGAWPGRSTGDITYDGAFMQTWETTRGQPGKSGLIVDFAPTSQSRAFGAAGPYGTSASDPFVAGDARDFAGRLDRVWPGAARHFTGKAVLSHYSADPFALGSYSGWLAGQYTKFAGYERVRQGNVHFAGEHCSVLLQGFMEGAAREGTRAAREVLASAGLALPA
jgi:monoamine oxidase